MAEDADIRSLAEKLAALELTDGERDALATALRPPDDEVEGFATFGLDLFDMLQAKGAVAQPSVPGAPSSLTRPGFKRGRDDLNPDFKIR